MTGRKENHTMKNEPIKTTISAMKKAAEYARSNVLRRLEQNKTYACVNWCKTAEDFRKIDADYALSVMAVDDMYYEMLRQIKSIEKTQKGV